MLSDCQIRTYSFCSPGLIPIKMFSSSQIASYISLDILSSSKLSSLNSFNVTVCSPRSTKYDLSFGAIKSVMIGIFDVQLTHLVLTNESNKFGVEAALT